VRHNPQKGEPAASIILPATGAGDPGV